jgi:hypothetical protein
MAESYEVLGGCDFSGGADGRVITRNPTTGNWSVEKDFTVTGNQSTTGLWIHRPNEFACACSGQDDGMAGQGVWFRNNSVWTRQNALLGATWVTWSCWGTGTDSIWIGGELSAAGGGKPTIWYYNGSNITQTYQLGALASGYFSAISGTADDNVYAVLAGVDNYVRRWNGGSWLTINPTMRSLYACFALDAAHVYVGGYSFSGADISIKYHNGTGWTSMTNPDVNHYVFGLWAAATDDIWAVGKDVAVNQGRIWHWNGAAWSTTSTGGGAVMREVYGYDTNNVWFIGESLGGTVLIYRWNGSTLSSESPPANSTVGKSVYARYSAGPPILTPVVPINQETEVSFQTNISFTLTHILGITDGWTVDIDIGNGQGWQQAVEHNGTPVFKTNWDGPASSITGTNPNYSVTIDPTIDLLFDNVVQVRVTATDSTEGLDVELG